MSIAHLTELILLPSGQLIQLGTAIREGKLELATHATGTSTIYKAQVPGTRKFYQIGRLAYAQLTVNSRQPSIK